MAVVFVSRMQITTPIDEARDAPSNQNVCVSLRIEVRAIAANTNPHAPITNGNIRALKTSERSKIPQLKIATMASNDPLPKMDSATTSASKPSRMPPCVLNATTIAAKTPRRTYSIWAFPRCTHRRGCSPRYRELSRLQGPSLRQSLTTWRDNITARQYLHNVARGTMTSCG